MEIGTKGRYGLEALVYMASCPENTQFSINTIATQRNISEKYLEQIFSLLKKGGIIQSSRGKYGGYHFLIAPKDLTVLEVLECLTGSLEPVKCIQSVHCKREAICKSKPVWEKMYDHMKLVLEDVTIQSLADEYRKQL